MADPEADPRRRLVESWCRWYDRQNPDDEWAEQHVIDAISFGHEGLEDGWATVLALLAEAPNDKVLGIIGASPIEDLLARDPVTVAAWIRAEAPENEPLRRALSHVWQMPSVPNDLFAEIKALAQDDLVI